MTVTMHDVLRDLHEHIAELEADYHRLRNRVKKAYYASHTAKDERAKYNAWLLALQTQAKAERVRHEYHMALGSYTALNRKPVCG